MPIRTYEKSGKDIEFVDELEDYVKDKRKCWRANSAKLHQRQRRYKKRITKEILKNFEVQNNIGIKMINSLIKLKLFKITLLGTFLGGIAVGTIASMGIKKLCKKKKSDTDKKEKIESK